jgi:beta-phosphoglucomutase
MARRIRWLFFDLDGVLVDSCDSHYEALNQALSEIGGTSAVIQREEHLNIFDGLSTRQKLAQLALQERIHEKDAPVIYRRKQELTLKFMRKIVKPKKEITKAIARVYGNYGLACVSNCIRQSVDILLELVGLDVFFDFTVSNEDVENPKPAGDPYALAVNKARCDYSNIVVFEDNDRGIASARSAGLLNVKRSTYYELTEDLVIRVVKNCE